MKILDTRNIRKKLDEYKRVMDLSLSLNELERRLDTGNPVFKDEQQLKKIAEKLKQVYPITDDNATILAMLILLTDGNPILQYEALGKSLLENSLVFHSGNLESNPYYKNIVLGNKNVGKFRVFYEKIRKHELCLLSPGKSSDTHKLLKISCIATFDHDFRYPCLAEGDNIWMSITPNEIFTIEESISEAHGNVLTLGLGMGYYAYMVSEKDNVDSVTIIEQSQDVIDILNELILPQFDHKEKIKIIKTNAFEYMEALNDGVFDYCFADIWDGSFGIIPYLKVRKTCRKFKSMKVSYWIGNSFEFQLQQVVLEIMINALHGIHLDTEFFKTNNDMYYVVGLVNDALKNVSITKADEIDYYLNIENLMELI